MSKTEVKKINNFRSLAVTLTVAFSVLIIVVLIIAGGFQVYFSFQVQQKNLVNNLTLIAHEAANTVNNFIQEKFSILVATVRLGDLITVSHEEQEATLDKLLGVEPAFRQLVLFNSQEQELLRVSRVSKLLSAELMKYDKSELFSKTSQKETYIGSSVYIDELTNEPIVIMAVPITDIFGDLKGTLIAETNLKFMWDLVAGMKIGNSGLAYVVDRKGNLIAFGDISRVLKGENLANLNLEEVNEFIKNEEPSILDTDKLDIAKGIQGANAVSSYISLGTPDWAVIVELPIIEAYATVIYGIGLSAATIILVALMAIIVSSYISKRITKPLISLTDAAKEMGGGKLDTKIEIKSRDEIGELATAFNEMAARLTAYTGQLESKVTERTAELANKLEELEKMNKLMIGRELKMVEMKKEIEELKNKSPKE